MIDPDVAYKFDEYYYPLPEDIPEIESDYSGFSDSLEAFASLLRQQRGTFAYLIAYPQYYVERIEEKTGPPGKIRTLVHRHVYFDPRLVAGKMLRDTKVRLANKYGIALNRIRIMNGGYRRARYLELWIVPRGQHAPIATPDAFPPHSPKKTRNTS